MLDLTLFVQSWMSLQWSRAKLLAYLVCWGGMNSKFSHGSFFFYHNSQGSCRWLVVVYQVFVRMSQTAGWNAPNQWLKQGSRFLLNIRRANAKLIGTTIPQEISTLYFNRSVQDTEIEWRRWHFRKSIGRDCLMWASAGALSRSSVLPRLLHWSGNGSFVRKRGKTWLVLDYVRQ